jgi:hypothetical protein
MHQAAVPRGDLDEFGSWCLRSGSNPARRQLVARTIVEIGHDDSRHLIWSRADHRDSSGVCRQVRLDRCVGELDGTWFGLVPIPDVELSGAALVCEQSDPVVIQESVGGVPELPLRCSQFC